MQIKYKKLQALLLIFILPILAMWYTDINIVGDIPLDTDTENMKATIKFNVNQMLVVPKYHFWFYTSIDTTTKKCARIIIKGYKENAGDNFEIAFHNYLESNFINYRFYIKYHKAFNKGEVCNGCERVKLWK